MPNTIAVYYSDELSEWKDSVTHSFHEIEELTRKLADVISRNSITGIAEKVEAHQEMLNLAAENLYRIETAIQQQEEALKNDSTLLDNEHINHETANRQNELRHRMQATEKQFIDVKFDCYGFLADTLQKK